MNRSPCYLLLVLLLAACLHISSAFAPSNFLQTNNINHQKSQPIATLININRKQSSALHISIGSYASSSIGTISTAISSLVIPLRRHAKLLLLLLTTVTTLLIATKKKSSLLWPGTHIGRSNSEYPLPPGSYGCPFIGYDLFRYVVSFCAYMLNFLNALMICSTFYIFSAVLKIMVTWQWYTNHEKWQTVQYSNHIHSGCQSLVLYRHG